MKIFLFLFTLFAFSLPAQAGMFTSIESRAEHVNAQTQGNNGYHAHLARKLASIAEEEKSQHDMEAAREFIRMAEDHAAQAGGAH